MAAGNQGGVQVSLGEAAMEVGPVEGLTVSKVNVSRCEMARLVFCSLFLAMGLLVGERCPWCCRRASVPGAYGDLQVPRRISSLTAQQLEEMPQGSPFGPSPMTGTDHHRLQAFAMVGSPLPSMLSPRCFSREAPPLFQPSPKRGVGQPQSPFNALSMSALEHLLPFHSPMYSSGVGDFMEGPFRMNLMDTPSSRLPHDSIFTPPKGGAMGMCLRQEGPHPLDMVGEPLGSRQQQQQGTDSSRQSDKAYYPEPAHDTNDDLVCSVLASPFAKVPLLPTYPPTVFCACEHVNLCPAVFSTSAPRVPLQCARWLEP